MDLRIPLICLAVFISLLAPTGLHAQLVKRAPDVYPGTIPEMRTVGYWVAKMSDPDEVLMTPDKIMRMNDAFRSVMKRPDPLENIPKAEKPLLITWWPGNLTSSHGIDGMSPAARADSVKSWISAEVDYVRRGRFGNVAGVHYSQRDIERFIYAMADDSVPGRIVPRTAIAIRHTRLRIVPSVFPHEQGIVDSSLSVSGRSIGITVNWDLWNNGFVRTGNPVNVLHASRNGEFLFVLSGMKYGWVSAGDIAFGGRDDIEKFTNPGNFVVCTGDRVPYYSDPECRTAAGWFAMGDRLPFAGRSYSRRIQVPMRTDRGGLSTGTAWLPEKADVHVGWLPYTRRNIVVTAFKLLDTPYDWTGAWFGRDHITTYRDIFRVFGFDLPPHDGLFPLYSGGRYAAVNPEIGRDAQYRTILAHEPFVTIMSCGGHAKLLLGSHNAIPVVFDHYGHGYTNDDGEYVELCRSYVGDMKIPAYFLNRPVAFLELR